MICCGSLSLRRIFLCLFKEKKSRLGLLVVWTRAGCRGTRTTTSDRAQSKAVS